ncbi:MAG: hypothetical protein LBU65_02040 [Planctomycetaceae bacterium]|nr:hypothetical protein [Planctomycetaceae bacterium]
MFGTNASLPVSRNAKTEYGGTAYIVFSVNYVYGFDNRFRMRVCPLFYVGDCGLVGSFVLANPAECCAADRIDTNT